MTSQIVASAADGQTWQQVGELLLAFALSSAIGLERQFRGKSAGLRTQAIVGTASALILLVSKYGFADVLADGQVVLDPSRVAAQIVSGIGFLGAGLIITRRGAIRGLTTAAAVWETAAVGMTAGAGLPLLALLVTALHFVIVFGYTPLGRLVADRGFTERSVTITYEDGRGVLRNIIGTCTSHSWTIRSMGVLESHRATGPGQVTVNLIIAGPRAHTAGASLATLDGVMQVDTDEDEED